ncbi:RNA exonuclease 4-like [Ostrinia furnacalis]|uniref:RNA exonuclease 4-like n=1 Tax=Ostrinia furnacalis TaxID=93504 RepID=UPI00103C59F5|nr:RNA exonuclease 4-like [Ostrinia furnacalis]
MSNRRVVALDTESVGLGPGNWGAVAQVSMVDLDSGKNYNAYIRRQGITDYRTEFSGLTPQVLQAKGRNFNDVKNEVLDWIRDAIVVGHAIHHDLRGLGIVVRQEDIRDTSKYWQFTQANNGKTPSLAFLAQRFLNKTLRRNGRHSCMEDAQTTMQLYRLVADSWEAELNNCYSSEESESEEEYYESDTSSSSDDDYGYYNNYRY